MKREGRSEIICRKCNIPLESGKTELSYQNQSMSTDLLKCPDCGQVYVSEPLAKGKMFEVEKALEDK